MSSAQAITSRTALTAPAAVFPVAFPEAVAFGWDEILQAVATMALALVIVLST